MIRAKAKIFLIFILFACTIFAQNNYTVKTKLSDNNIETERTITITVIKNGESFYSIKKTLRPFYSIPQVIVFKSGNIVLLHSLEGTIEFYDLTKNLIFKEENLITELYNEHKVLFSNTSTKIALLISENLENRIIIFNDKGEQLFTERVEKGIANGIVLSDENNKLAISLYKWKGNEMVANSYILDLSENKKKQFPVLFNKGLFNHSGNLFCGFTNKEFFNIDLLRNKIILNKKIPDNKILLDLQINKQNTYYIEAELPKLNNGVWEYQSAKVFKIDGNYKIELVKKINTTFSKILFIQPTNQSLLKTTKEEFSLEIIP